METGRNGSIDFIRALAIIVMIYLHALAYYLDEKGVYFLWDIGQFAVPFFIFCSAYLFFVKDFPKKDFDPLAYIKKRLSRLLIPYYIFLTIAFAVIYLTRPKELTPAFAANSILLVAGVDISWLVLLFVCFTFILPLLRYLIQNHSLFFNLYSLIAFFSGFYLLAFHFRFNYRLIMWVPWSTILIYGYYYVKNAGNKKFLVFNIIGSLVVFILGFLYKKYPLPMIYLQANKYPPNAYFLSYGWFFLNLILLFDVGRYRIFYFVSRHSYSLFFIQWLVIYILVFYHWHFKVSWPIFFLLILIISFLIQIAVNYLKKLKRNRFFKPAKSS